MDILRRRLGGGGLLIALLVLSAPAYATSQCPLEFGQKDPLVNVLGWLVVAVGLVIGGLLLSCLVRRSRGMRRSARAAVVVLGVVGMMLVWLGGLVLALKYFFLQC